ncbi:MAG TPA: hypothetical protein VKG63_11090 [Steroidobacteraceae bacterium]|nr:hypothetical protein [Steroidobacteraceae bacterium]
MFELRIVLSFALLTIAALAHAKEYGHYDLTKIVTVSESPDGKRAATVNFVLLNDVLNDLSIHNNNYPSQFDSAADRERAVADVTAISTMLDVFVDTPAPDLQLLIRAAVLYGIGHNLDVPGAAEKAMSAFTTLLNKTPDDPRANYLYGKFLLSAGKLRDAIPALEKAKSLGAVLADYSLGVAYILVGDKNKALENLQQYAKQAPDDGSAAKLIDAIRSGEIEFKTGTP